MKLFGKKKKKAEEGEKKELEIEDLITLERYEEAEQKLKERLKIYPKDLYSHLKLAEVYVASKDFVKAMDEYVFVADSHADDGFFDKAIAVLQKVSRLAPGDDTVPRRLEKYQHMKRLEFRRRLAIEGLLENETTAASDAANTKLHLELLWNKIARSHLVQKLEGEQLKRLFRVMDMRSYKEKEVLAKAGSSEASMFLIVDGEVEARAEVGGKEMSLRSFTTGDLIGDSVLLEKKSWPATYVAKQPGTLFELDREGLQQTMHGNEDPVGFLSVLREQHQDRDVAVSLQKLRAR